MEHNPCNICFEHFNDQNRCPFNLNCGHTFCKECIIKIISKLEKNTNCTLDCPNCKKTTDIFSKETLFETQLSKNYLVLDLIQKNKPISECTHSNPSFICLSDSCITSSYCCIDCLPKFHKNCVISNSEKAKNQKHALEKAAKNYGLFELKKNKINIGKKIDELFETLKSFDAVFNKKFNKLMVEFSLVNFDEEKKEKDLLSQNDGKEVSIEPISTIISQNSLENKKKIDQLFKFNKIVNDEFLRPVENLISIFSEQTNNLENEVPLIFNAQNLKRFLPNLEPLTAPKPEIITVNVPIACLKCASNVLPSVSQNETEGEPKLYPIPFFQRNEPPDAFKYEFHHFQPKLVDEIKDVIEKAYEAKGDNSKSLEASIRSRLRNVLGRNFTVELSWEKPKVYKHGSTVFIGRLFESSCFVEVVY